MSDAPKTPAERDADAATERSHMRRDIRELRQSIGDMKKAQGITDAKLDQLLDAWKGASGVLVVMKWASATAATLAALWAVFGPFLTSKGGAANKRIATAGAAIALLAAMPLILPGLKTLEAGRDRGAPYRDRLAKGAPWTVCDGKLIDTPRRYTEAECDAMTAQQVLEIYGPPVLLCVPALGLPERRNQLVASVWLAWNIGPPRFCKSTAARRFNVGDWRGGCNAFAPWNKSNGIVRPGLINRRNYEIRRCLTGLS